jgi:hypothetical protein
MSQRRHGWARAAMERTIDFAKKASDQKRTLRKTKSCKNAFVEKEGDGLIGQSPPKKSLLELLATLEPLDEEFSEI